MNGPLSNIHDDGFAAASFHSFPDTLAWDAYSGDYGPNHVGLVLGTGAYLAQDDDVPGGLAAYGAALETTTSGSGSTAVVTLRPRDAARRRVFVGPLGLLVEIDAAAIESVAYTASDASLVVTLGQLDGVPTTNSTVMWLSREDGDAGYTVTGAGVAEARLGWQIPLGSGSVSVSVVPS